MMVTARASLMRVPRKLMSEEKKPPALLWGIFFRPSQDVWDYLGITGAIYFTGAIVVLTAGLYWKRASRMGARWALFAGLSAVVGLGPVKTALGLESVGPAEIGLGTLALAVVAMVVGSLLFPDRDAEEVVS